MSISKNQFIVKGLFALGAVAVVGSSTAVYAAINTTGNTTSGYGSTSQQATAAANTFANSVNSSQVTFDNTVTDLIDEAATTLPASSTNQLRAGYDSATNNYDAATQAAYNNFLNSVNNAANTAESKDAFIDAFNRAKAEYFNQLDVAKNNFAAQVSNLGDQANQAKDRFMNGYNSSRDAYGNQLEAAKNDFAATVSNLR